MVKRIAVGTDSFAVVDDADYEMLSAFKWSELTTQGYVYARMRGSAENGYHTVLMHRLVVGVDGESRHIYIDHRNGNTLDNRRSNLRVCDNKGNQGNRKLQGGSSKYRGVCWHKEKQRWHAKLRINRHTVHLGYFDTEEEAAKAWNEAAVQHFGEFAKLNDV